MQDFQNRGEALRQRYGIDGTTGDAQDVLHPYHHDDDAGICLLCGMPGGYRKHIIRDPHG